MSGFSPPSEDRSRSRASGESSFSDPELLQQSGRALVPAASTILRFTGSSPAPQRSAGYSSSSASATPPQRGPELSATQATFLAGAAVTHAHHASNVALGAATAAHQAAEREQVTIANAQDAVRHFAGQAAAAEASYHDQARAIAHAAQAAVDNATQREATLRQEAQAAIATTTHEAQQRVTAIQGEAQQAIAHSNQTAQARIRLAEGEAIGLSVALREANEARERAEAAQQHAERYAAQRDEQLARLANDMEEMKKRHAEAMSRMTDRFHELSAQFADRDRELHPRTPTRVHLSFPDMSFSPDTGQNDTVPSAPGPMIVPVLEEATLSTPLPEQPVGESDAPTEGAAAGAPGGAATEAQPATTTQPSEPHLSARIDELTKLVSNLATLVYAGSAQPGSSAAPSGAAQGAPAEASSGQAPQVPVLNLSVAKVAPGAPGSPGSGGSSSSSSSSSSSARSRYPACRMCGSRRHAEEGCPDLTSNKPPGKDDGSGPPPGGSPCCKRGGT